MHPGVVRSRRRRRTRLILIIVVGALVLLVGLGAAAVAGVRYAQGLIDATGSGGFDDGSGEFAEGPVNAPVERLDLVSTVAATGSLASAKPITLGFPGPGEVTELTVAVGDTVAAGQVLARQDPRLAQLDLDAAQAALASAERAAGLRAPSTADEQKAQDAQVAQARVAVDAATSALSATRAVIEANAVTLQSAIDAAQRQLDRDRSAAAAATAAIGVALAAEPTADFAVGATNELAAAKPAAATARAAVVAAAEAVATATAGGNDAAIATAQARLDAATTASGAADARVVDAQAAIDAVASARAATSQARATAAAAETTVATSADALVGARDARRAGLASDAQTVDSAKSALAQARAALTVLVTGNAVAGANGEVATGTSPEELQVAVDRAELDVERAQTALDRLTIVAPIAATVTKVNATVGQTLGDTSTVNEGAASGGGVADVITLSTAQQLVAEITIPETDAIKLEPGMAAEFKFSAIPDVIGAGKVLTVLPTDTSSGTAEQTFDPFTGQPSTQKTYTITMSVLSPPPGARGGLTIAARVTVGEQQAALVVPTAALSEFDGTAVVQRVIDDGTTEEVEVEIGLRQGGYTQILSGLDEGDEVQIGSSFPPDGGSVPEGVLIDGG